MLPFPLLLLFPLTDRLFFDTNKNRKGAAL